MTFKIRFEPTLLFAVLSSGDGHSEHCICVCDFSDISDKMLLADFLKGLIETAIF